MAIVGFLLLSLAGYLAYDAYTLQKTGIKTQGKVVSLERSGGSHFPVFTFTDNNNHILTIRSGISSKDYLPGDAIPVLYDPAKPLGAVVNEPLMLHLLDGIFVLLGAIFLLVAHLVNRYLVNPKNRP